MTTVGEIKNALSRLSREEMLEVQDWLEIFLEDQLTMTDEFKAKIERSESEMNSL